MEGFTHLIPHAAGHEMIRQGRRDLHLVRMTPDIVYDQLIGAGCARKSDLLVGRQPGRRLVAPLPRRRRARWPQAARDRGAQPRGDGGALRRPAHPGCRSACCAATWAPTCRRTPTTIAPITCPFTGEELTAVPALNPDVADHPRPAGRPMTATCSCGASSACRKRRSSLAARPIVTVEEIVDELTPTPGRVSCSRAGRSTPCARCPAVRTRASRWDTATATTRSTGPGTPSPRDRDTFTDWIDRHILSTADYAEYRRSVGLDDIVTATSE